MSLKQATLIAKVTVSSLLIIILLNQIGGINAFAEVLSNISLRWCFVGAIAALIHLSLSGLNIWLLLRAAGIELALFKFINIFVHSYGIGLLLPGQTGDAVIAVFLKKSGVPISTSGACYVVDKIITLSFMLAISVYGFHILIPSTPLIILVGVYFLFILACFASLHLIKFIPTKGELLTRIVDAAQSLRDMVFIVFRKRRFVFINVLITFLNWFVLAFCYYSVFRGLHQIVDWPMVGVIPVMASFVGYIPISIGGVGTVEFSATYLFGLIGIPKAVVLGTYFIQRIIQYSLAGILVITFSILGPNKSISSYESSKT